MISPKLKIKMRGKTTIVNIKIREQYAPPQRVLSSKKVYKRRAKHCKIHE